jgi:L-asparaginase II
VGPIVVRVTRGGIVESRHRVHAVLVRDGSVERAAGDPELVCYLRSSAKPLQAIPLVDAYEDLDDREVAIASASHLADDAQLAAVRMLLARAGASEDDLECGPERGLRLNHNCSGKHAGMLATCRARGWPTRGYRLPDHPLQVEIRALVERATGERAPVAVDGCGVPTFAVPLTAAARSLIDLPERIRAAMRAHPELIRGHGAPDTRLMQLRDGWIAKGGAEGLLCASHPDGTGLALKVEDGNGRAVGAALGAFLGIDELRVAQVANSRGEAVGEIVAESA